jgi:transcription elongation factor GreA
MASIDFKQVSLTKTFVLTKSGLDDLKKRLNILLQDKRTIRERLRSMDAEEKMYSAVSADEVQLLEMTEVEAAKIATIIDNAELITDVPDSSIVQIGSKVTLKAGMKNLVCYTVVTGLEADPLVGKISNDGPFGRALLGKKQGEIISIVTPKGQLHRYEIAKIE